MKKACILCRKAKGKRLCKLHDNAPVCPPCCASVRNQDCEGCRHYTFSQHFHESKAKKPGEKTFIIEIDEAVEKEVDHAMCLVENHAVQEGKHIIRKLLGTHPKNHMVHYAMGVCCAFEGDHDTALKYFNTATDIFPYFPEAHFNKGVVYQKKLDLRQMIEAFQHVIELGDPEEAYVQEAKETVRSFEKQFEKDGLTLQTYFKAMDHFEEGVAAMEARKWSQAIQNFKRCIAINPKNPQSYGNMGICYGKLGEKGLALEVLDRALELDPAYEPAMVNRFVIESLQDGEELPSAKVESVEYYKEYAMKKKSYIQSFLEQFQKEKP